LLLVAALPLWGQSASPVGQNKSGMVKPAPRGKKPASAVAAAVQQPVAIAPLTPETMPAEPPRVSYRNGLLQIYSRNATLSDILNAVRRQTGAQIDPAPNGSERVAAQLSGRPREVLSALLDGANVGYILVGSPDNPDGLNKVLLSRLSTAPASAPPVAAASRGFQPQVPPEPEEDEPPPEAMMDRNPAMDQQQMQPGMPGMAGQPGQPIVPGQPIPGQPGQPFYQPGQPNPMAGGEQPRFGTPGEAPQQVPPQANQPGQPQVKTPDQLLQELQRLRNQINVNPNANASEQPQQ
jgi:hypothetical protein